MLLAALIPALSHGDCKTECCSVWEAALVGGRAAHGPERRLQQHHGDGHRRQIPLSAQYERTAGFDSLFFWPDRNQTMQMLTMQKWGRDANSRRRRSLVGHRKLMMDEWMDALDPSQASMFQVGANVHSATTYLQSDPAPKAVKLGWQSTLLEPMPNVFAALQKHYTPPPLNVRLVNAAVCDACGASGLAMWSVDMDSTANYGTNDSDTRCLTANAKAKGTEHHFVSELASLSKEHVLTQNRLFARGVKQCRVCSAYLQRPMPENCMRNVIVKNLVSTPIACYCTEREVQSGALPASLSLLMVDAEGHDHYVLYQFPWAKVRPARVVFEAYHLGGVVFARLAEFLRSLGYELIVGGFGAFVSIWQHANSNEVLKPEVAARYANVPEPAVRQVLQRPVRASALSPSMAKGGQAAPSRPLASGIGSFREQSLATLCLAARFTTPSAAPKAPTSASQADWREYWRSDAVRASTHAMLARRAMPNATEGQLATVAEEVLRRCARAPQQMLTAAETSRWTARLAREGPNSGPHWVHLAP